MAQTAAAEPLGFALRNSRLVPASEIARVSIPVPAGRVTGEPGGVVTSGAERIPVQADVITRHPDGSVRRLMLSFPAQLAAGASAEFAYDPAAGGNAAPALAQVNGDRATVRTDAFSLQAQLGEIVLTDRDGRVLASIRPLGPALTGAGTPVLTAIQNGACAVWLRWRQDGTDYSREVDVQADSRGRVRLVQRLLRHLKGNDWTPDFGLELTAAGGVPVRLPESPVHFLSLPGDDPLGRHPELVAALKLADGTPLAVANPLALRQHRGTLAATVAAGALGVRFSRLEPVAKETDNLLLQEGMWQTLDVVFQPGAPEGLAAAVDTPLTAQVDWRLYDAVYRTGPPLEVKSPMLRALVEKYLTALQGVQLRGDDFGSFGGLERYNHCAYVWEDWFRTGDTRLRDVALAYSENYNDFSVNWGPNPDCYGGGRYPPNARTQPWSGTFRTRQNDAVTFCTKGYHGFWLAYEETGDPRFRYAAEQQAKWSATHVHATVSYMRCIGQVTDFVRMFEYTGERFYLDNAARLWTEFQACQNPDLLFNEGGLPSTGNDLYVPDDSFGYQHPYVKAYIVQYATNALPDLLRHRPEDKRLRDTILACNDWMAKVQTAAGGWSYPGPTTAGFHWSIEYCHGLLRGYEIEPKPLYLDAVQRTLRAIVALVDVYDAIPSSVTPWERLAGMSNADMGAKYRLGTDRDRTRDFTDGRLEFGCSADSTVYLHVLLRDYLAHRSEETLFASDAVLDQVLKLPTSLPGGHRQSGDPSLRIAALGKFASEGWVVRLEGSASRKLAGKDLVWRWALAGDATKDGAQVEWTFPRRGTFDVKLVACEGTVEHTRTLMLAAPAGPGDIGMARWPDGIRLQAEALTGQGGGATPIKVRTPGEKLGADGGAISHWEAVNAWAEWAFETPRAGRWFLLVKHASPVACQRQVAVDGGVAGTLALAATGGFGSQAKDDWSLELLRDPAGQPLAVELTPGRHVLRLTGNDGKGCNLDYLELLPAATAPP